MSRGLSPTAIARLEASSGLAIRHLLEFTFPTGVVYLTDNIKNIEFNGNTYQGAGVALRFDSVEETVLFQDSQTSVTLSGIPDEVLSIITNESFVNQPFRAYRVFLDQATSQFIEDPYLVYEGVMNGAEFPYDRGINASLATVSVSSELARFNGKNGRRSNDEEQQGLFPGDDMFKFQANLSEKKIEF